MGVVNYLVRKSVFTENGGPISDSSRNNQILLFGRRTSFVGYTHLLTLSIRLVKSELRVGVNVYMINSVGTVSL